eukprot:2594355-Pyramimonas_sp.AAC.1
MAFDRVRVELEAWYADQRRPGNKPDEIDHFSAKMCGTNSSRNLKTRAGEARWLFKFVATVLIHKYKHLVRKGDELHACTAALHEWGAILAATSEDPDEETQWRLENACIRHLVLCSSAEIPYKPKHHLFWHL